MIIVFGEITSKGQVDYQKVIRDAIKEIGYDDSNKGILGLQSTYYNILDTFSPSPLCCNDCFILCL